MDVVCRQANCNDAFVGITEKIVERIEGGSDPVFSVKEVVSEFKEMLKSISSANLSRAEIIGLLGELYLLRKSRSDQSKRTQELVWSCWETPRLCF